MLGFIWALLPHVSPARHARDRPRNLATAFSDTLRVSRVVHGHERLFLIYQTSAVLVAHSPFLQCGSNLSHRRGECDIVTAALGRLSSIGPSL